MNFIQRETNVFDTYSLKIMFQAIKITPQERLKKKMQALLNRQCKSNLALTV